MSNYETLRHLLRTGHFDDPDGEDKGERLLSIEAARSVPAGRLTPDEAQALLLELRLRRVRGRCSQAVTLARST